MSATSLISRAGGIDPLTDQLLTVREAAGKFGELENGPAPSYSTMMRRFNPKDPDQPVLDSIKIGGRRYTTLEAILAWIAAMNGWDEDDEGAAGALVPAPKPPKPRTPLQRAKSIRRSDDEAKKKCGVQPTLEPLPLDEIL